MILIHIPHSSIEIPSKYGDQFILDDVELLKEAKLMADIFVDKIVENINEEKLIFPISRIVCDVERFRNDNDEEMSKIGMGVIYEKTHDCKQLRKNNIKEQNLEEIKKEYYDKHHELFEKKVEEALKKQGTCTIVDLHSYAETALPYEINKKDFRPDICIGYENFHFDKNIVNKIKQLCETKDIVVGENTPFKGSIVPLKFYKKNKNVKSVMIEINKRLYLQKDGTLDKTKLKKLQELMNKIIKILKG